jgi:hypothetical protein
MYHALWCCVFVYEANDLNIARARSMHASSYVILKKEREKKNQQENVCDDALESWKYLDCNKNVTWDHVVMASLTFK